MSFLAIFCALFSILFPRFSGFHGSRCTLNQPFTEKELAQSRVTDKGGLPPLPPTPPPPLRKISPKRVLWPQSAISLANFEIRLSPILTSSAHLEIFASQGNKISNMSDIFSGPYEAKFSHNFHRTREETAQQTTSRGWELSRFLKCAPGFSRKDIWIFSKFIRIFYYTTKSNMTILSNKIFLNRF